MLVIILGQSTMTTVAFDGFFVEHFEAEALLVVNEEVKVFPEVVLYNVFRCVFGHKSSSPFVHKQHVSDGNTRLLFKRNKNNT